MERVAFTRTYLLLHRYRLLSDRPKRTQVLIDTHYVERRLRTPWFVTAIHGRRTGQAREEPLNMDSYPSAPPYEHPAGLESW